MAVKCVIKHSDNIAVLEYIYAYIVVSTIILVCVMRHSVTRAI